MGAVNFPQVLLPSRSSGTRFIHAHRNALGSLGNLNEAFARRGINMAAQYCQTDSEIGYVVLDVEGGVEDAEDLLAELRGLPGTICARLCMSRSSSRTFLISTLAASIWLPPPRSLKDGAITASAASLGKAARLITGPRRSAGKRPHRTTHRARSET